MKVERRTFLKMLVAAGVGSADFLYPGLGRAASRAGAPSRSMERQTGAGPMRLQGPDPTYGGGQVVAKTTSGVVLKSDAAVRAVRIPEGTVVWKEFDVTADAIQLQDWVDLKGAPLADGSLQAKSGWIYVNIGRVDGVVDETPASVLVIKQPTGRRTLELSTRLEVISVEDGSPLPGGIAALTPGTAIGAVGLRLPDGGFRATRVWAPVKS